jgi:hypothetical protein
MKTASPDISVAAREHSFFFLTTDTNFIFVKFMPHLHPIQHLLCNSIHEMKPPG